MINNPNIDTRRAFALLLETAGQQFEVLRSLIRQELLIASNQQPKTRQDTFSEMRAQGCIQMALAKEFLFNAARAYRLCDLAERPETGLCHGRRASQICRHLLIQRQR